MLFEVIMPPDICSSNVEQHASLAENLKRMKIISLIQLHAGDPSWFHALETMWRHLRAPHASKDRNSNAINGVPIYFAQ